MDTVQAHLQTDIVGHTNWKPLASPKESAKPPLRLPLMPMLSCLNTSTYSMTMPKQTPTSP